MTEHDDARKARRALVISSFILVVFSYTTFKSSDFNLLGLEFSIDRTALIWLNRVLVVYFGLMLGFYHEGEMQLEDFKRAVAKFSEVDGQLERMKKEMRELSAKTTEVLEGSLQQKQRYAKHVAMEKRFAEMELEHDRERSPTLEEQSKIIKNIYLTANLAIPVSVAAMAVLISFDWKSIFSWPWC